MFVSLNSQANVCEALINVTKVKGCMRFRNRFTLSFLDSLFSKCFIHPFRQLPFATRCSEIWRSQTLVLVLSHIKSIYRWML